MLKMNTLSWGVPSYSKIILANLNWVEYGETVGNNAFRR